jgi:hypothetical protein
MRGFYPVCQVTELAAGYRDTTLGRGASPLTVLPLSDVTRKFTLLR